jgi:hypothetical protein
MKRRDFIKTVAAGGAGWLLSVRASQSAQAGLIGVLYAGRAEDPFGKFFVSAFATKLTTDEHGSAPGPKPEIQYRAPRTMTILLLDLPPPWRDARFQW